MTVYARRAYSCVMTTHHPAPGRSAAHDGGAVMAPTPTTLLTGWAALPALREADRLVIAGDVAGRNAVLRTIDPAYWNGRELLPEGETR